MNTRSVIEAILFVAERPVPTEELAQVLERPIEEIRAELESMAAELEERSSGLVLREAGGGWRLSSHPDVRPYLEQFAISPAATISATILTYRLCPKQWPTSGPRWLQKLRLISTV